MVWLTDAQTPPGLRLYAIGDVHGCIEPLEAVHEWIEADLKASPPEDYRIIHVGDYMDRGPDSRGVLDFLIERSAGDGRLVNLLGNHDLMFALARTPDSRMRRIWIGNGGVETLDSYDLTLDQFLDMLSSGEGVSSRIPDEHFAFIEDLPASIRFGDYIFVHAGIKPGVPLDRQSPDDLLWIREPFLRDGREHEGVIVHGHTPVRRVDVRANRIGIDTGAVFGGHLTCLVLDGMAKARLGPDGRMPLVG